MFGDSSGKACKAVLIGIRFEVLITFLLYNQRCLRGVCDQCLVTLEIRSNVIDMSDSLVRQIFQ